MLKIACFAVAGLALTGCGPWGHLGVVDMKRQDPAEVARSMEVRVSEGTTNTPKIARAIGPVNATSCKNMMTDPPATRGDALRQLRLKALRMGANAVVNVYFDERGTDAWGTNCWESVTATGDAVVIAK